MNLQGSLARLQKASTKLYLQLAEHFSGNAVIRDTWSAMAQDLELHAESLRALRPTFWKQLKKEEKNLILAIKDTAGVLDWKVASDHEAGSLHHCFTRTLDFEEPLALKLYSPLIYRLRTEWTDRALDFYIMVNAHLTRLARLMRSFSGDPALIQRCADLIHQFEKEAQGPEPQPIKVTKKSRKKAKTARSTRVSRTAGAQPKTRRTVRARRSTPVKKRASVSSGRAKQRAKRSKPILKRIKLSSRRARR